MKYLTHRGVRLSLFAPIAIVSILCMALISGCTRTIYTPVVRTEKIVDTLVQQIADSAALHALFECDSNNRVIMRALSETKGATATQDVSFSDGELRVETRWKTKYVDRIHQVHDTTTVVEVREVVRTEKHVPTFFWWCFAVALITAGWGVVKIIRRFR